jgi:CheY-like chemotaxis protein
MRVLVAEDEPDICLTYRMALESRNHEAIMAHDGDECMDIYTKEFLDTQKNEYYHNYVSEHNNCGTSLTNNYGNNTVILPNSSGNSITHHHHDSYSPFDAVVLDYRIPGKDGLQVAKEILELNPEQRIIFASAYVKETLENSVKELKRVVELMQKPFDADILVDTIEDKEAQEGLKILMKNLMRKSRNRGNYNEEEEGDHNHQDHNGDRFEPSLEQLRDIFEGLRKIQKGRTF